MENISGFLWKMVIHVMAENGLFNRPKGQEDKWLLTILIKSKVIDWTWMACGDREEAPGTVAPTGLAYFIEKPFEDFIEKENWARWMKARLCFFSRHQS
jgi:hypothetical protein